MNQDDSIDQEIDEATVRRYFDGAGGGTAAAVSMMAHEHNLPGRAAPRTIKVAPDGCFVDLLINGVILIHRYLPPKEPLVLVTTVTTLPEPSTLASMRKSAVLSRPPTHHNATLISCDDN